MGRARAVSSRSGRIFDLAIQDCAESDRRSCSDLGGTTFSIDHAVDVTANDITEISLERQSDLSRLASLTRELLPRDRELIALKYGAGISNRDIARLTGLTESNVGTILHRVVQSLRARW